MPVMSPKLLDSVIDMLPVSARYGSTSSVHVPDWSSAIGPPKPFWVHVRPTSDWSGLSRSTAPQLTNVLPVMFELI